MFTSACCFAVGLGLQLDLVSGCAHVFVLLSIVRPPIKCPSITDCFLVKPLWPPNGIAAVYVFYVLYIFSVSATAVVRAQSLLHSQILEWPDTCSTYWTIINV